MKIDLNLIIQFTLAIGAASGMVGWLAKRLIDKSLDLGK